MPNEKIFRLKLKLEEVIIEDDTGLFPLFSNSQTSSGVDQIKPILNGFNEQLLKFIDVSLNKIKHKG